MSRVGAQQENGEQEPLISYQNPYMTQENMAVAQEGMLDNVSVGSGPDQDAIDMVKEKGVKGQAQSMKETIADAKKVTGEVLAKQEDEQPWFLAPLVVALFLFFDVGKILGEKVAQGPHGGNTINSSLLNNYIIVINVILAFSLTVFFMGFGPGMAKMFEWELLSGYALPSAFFAVAQLFNLLQNNFLESSARKVFSQLRILLTALLSKVIMGAGYTTLQWMMLVAITLSVFQFLFLTSSEAAPLSGDQIPIGLVFSVISNVCAVLGSLVGEKHMKATKKLPFYLQKFQFESWTFVFAFIGIFVTNPLGAWMADGALYGMGLPGAADDIGTIISLRGKNGLKANVFGSVAKAAFFTVDDNTLTNIGYDAKVIKFQSQKPVNDVLSSGNPVTERIPNRFAMKGWTSLQDSRGEQMFKNVVSMSEDTPDDYASNFMTRNDLYSMIENYAAIAARRAAPSATEDLSTWTKRDNYLTHNNAMAMPSGALKNHHKSRYRTMKFANMLMDTKFTTKAPYAMCDGYSLVADLKLNFSMYLGKNQKTAVMDKFNENGPTVEVDKFIPFKLFERDSPTMTASKLSLEKSCRTEEGKGPENSEKIAKFAAGENKYLTVLETGLPLHFAVDGTESIKSAYNQFVQKKCVDAAELSKEDSKAGKMLKKDFDFTVQDLEKAQNWSTRYEFSKAVAYARTAKSGEVKDDTKSDVTVTFKRKAVASLKKQDSEFKDITNIFEVFSSKSFAVKFTCEKLLDYGVESETRTMTSGKGFRVQCAISGLGKNDDSSILRNLANFKQTAKAAKYQSGATKLNKKNKMEQIPAVADKAADVACPSLDQRLYFGVEDADRKFVNGFAPNDRTKFPHFTETQVFEYLSKFQTADAWSHAGKLPDNAATIDIAQTNSEQRKSNGFAALGRLGLGFVDPNLQLNGGMYGKENMEDHADPFSWSIFHGYSFNPTPFPFLFKFSVAFAIFSNGGQSWMSAYLSKVLSSLWKNICAAVALALVIMIEKIFMVDNQEWEETRGMNVLLGSAGIMLTVFMFQLLPKAPKPEAKDVETGHGKH